jgi:CHAT domain-containing protein/Tfp pilus assembly protein PilF
MSESLPSDETVRDYLLGRVSEEAKLEWLEDLLFANEEFCSRVALVEDSLINDYVFGQLNREDTESFRATLETNPDRSFKLELTQALRDQALTAGEKARVEKSSFLSSLKAFFRQPQYVGALAILLIVAVSLVVYINWKSKPDQLAELRSIYRQERPTETRLSEFGYAPLVQLRGATPPDETSRLRRIENNLSEAAETNPTAETHHALGVFYLTQRKYPEAIKELNDALALASKNARIHNDLGAAHFELAKTLPREKKLVELAQSLESFTSASQLDPNFLESLFNKSLALQEMGMPRQAKESWTLYLQKDPSSQWADEARKHLAQLESPQSLFKKEDEVIADFLVAFRRQDLARARLIHDETKGTLQTVAVPLQLSRRYLVARQSGDETGAKESLDALTFLGNAEQTETGDSLFFELASFYRNVGADKIDDLLRAKDLFGSAYRTVSSDYTSAIGQFEKSRDLFSQLGDDCEAAIAEIWAVQFLPDINRVTESRQRLTAVIAVAEKRKFVILLPPAYYWLGMGDYKQSRFSESALHLKAALRFAEAGKNIFEIGHAQQAIVENYSELGELEPALFYASKMLGDGPHYYQNPGQAWRDQGTLADLTLKLNFFSTSLSLAQESLNIAQEKWPDSSLVNNSLRRTTEAAKKRDSTTALTNANQSLRIALARVDSPENRRTIAEIYPLLGDLKSQTNNCTEALLDYDKALELYRDLPEVTERLYEIHKGKLFCLRQLNRPTEFSLELATVLKLSEKYRRTIREDDSRQAFFATEQVVFDEAVANALENDQSKDAFDFVEKSKARSLLDFVKSEKSIVEVEKSFGPVAQPLMLSEIQARLPEQVQVVQYAVLPEKLAIWIVSKTRFDLVEREITSSLLEEKVAKYQAAIVGRASTADIKLAGQVLYQILLPPGLASDKQLCLVPDKSLHQLSFSTLVSPAGQYLLQDYTLFYAPSASVLVLATENAQRKEHIRNESLLSVGNPDFDRLENPNLPDLRDAENEATTIGRLYPKSVELLGAGATREKFLFSLTNVEVVHFAGHFLANRQSPGNSKLLFAGDDLRSADLSAYKLPKAKLVVLSACETGFEHYNKSEGAIGAARTFLALGGPAVVATQWKVDSESTRDLMIAFHQNRKQKTMSSAESLRKAQLEMLSKEKTSAPFYWAPFSLFGGYVNY